MNSTSNGSSQGTKTPAHATQQPLRSLETNVLLSAPGVVWDQECWLVQSYFQCSISLMLWSCPSANVDGRDFLFLCGWKSPPTSHVETKQTQIIATWNYPSASLTNSSQYIHSVTMGMWARVNLMGQLPWLSLEVHFSHLVPIFSASHWILDLIFGQQVPCS